MPSRNPRLRVEDMLHNVQSIERYANGFTWEELQGDELRRDAIERCIGRISEAAVKLAEFTETAAPEIEWVQIRRIGNVIRHEYDRVDFDLIWNIIQDELPQLKAACERMLATLPPDPE